MIAESSSLFTGTKYLGAKWLEHQKMHTLSPLAVKVANVLGQVFEGIYHLTDTNPRSLDGLYKPATEYMISTYGSIATHDSNRLTRLLLCCQAAGLNVSILGSFKGYLRLKFKTGRSIQPHIDTFKTISDLALLADSDVPGWRLQLGVKQTRSNYINDLKSLYTIVWKSDDGNITGIDRKSDYIGMLRIKNIVSLAHSACCRAEIQGRCPSGFGQLMIFYTQRSRTAQTIINGHPTAEHAIEMLRTIWDIDYTRSD